MTNYPTCTVGGDACGPLAGTYQVVEPTGSNACTSGALNSSSPANTSDNWRWSCGALTCSAIKPGCNITTDTNYSGTNPANNYNCSGSCLNGMTNYPTCTVGGSTPDLTAGNVTPSTAEAGNSTQFSSTITNNGTGSTGASFYNFLQVATGMNGGGVISDVAAGAQMASLASSANRSYTSSYTFPSAGTYSVRVCADKQNSGDGGVITESNEGNNCSPSWTNVTVTTPATITLSMPDCTVALGQSSCISKPSQVINPTPGRSYSLKYFGPGPNVTSPATNYYTPGNSWTHNPSDVAAAGTEVEIRHGADESAASRATVGLYDSIDRNTVVDTARPLARCAGNTTWSIPAGICIAVSTPPVISTFTNNGPITSGNSATLTWGSVTGTGVSCSIDNGLGVASTAGSSRSTGALAVSTTYNLTCSNVGGTVIWQTTVTVIGGACANGATNFPTCTTCPLGNSFWNGTACVPCGATGCNSCTATIANPTDNCVCNNGETPGLCIIGSMVGTLDAMPLSCVIGANGNTCPVTLIWEVKNHQGPLSAVTRDGTGGNLYTGHMNLNQSTNVPYESDGNVIYRLYNNSIELTTRSVGVSCLGSTAWNGTSCQTCGSTGCTNNVCNNGATNAPSCTTCPLGNSYWNGSSCVPCGATGCNSCTATIASPIDGCRCNNGNAPGACAPGGASATLTVPSCVVTVAHGGTCTSNVSWTSSDTTAPVSVRQTGTQFSTAVSNGGTLRTLSYNIPLANTFTFYDNGGATLLDTKVGTVSCSNTPGNVLVGSGLSCVPCSNGGCDPGPVCINGATNPPSCTTCPLGNSFWNGTACVPCGATGCNSCTATIANPTDNCLCNNGQTPGLCVVGGMSGTLSAAPLSCTVGAGNSTCSVTLSWNVLNRTGPTTAVTRDGTPGDLYTGHTNPGQAIDVPYESDGNVIYRLYNNSIELTTRSVGVSCLGSTAWNGTSCQTCGSTGCTNNVCNNGATNAPSCTTCPLGNSYWNGSSCVPCGATGCNSCTATIASPIDGCRCNNGNAPGACTAPICVPPSVWGTTQCVNPQVVSFAVSGVHYYTTPEALVFQCSGSTHYRITKNTVAWRGVTLLTPGPNDVQTVTPDAGSADYQVFCINEGIEDASLVQPYTSTPPNPPTILVDAYPKTINSGGKTTVSWTIVRPRIGAPLCKIEATPICSKGTCSQEETTAYNVVKDILRTEKIDGPGQQPTIAQAVSTKAVGQKGVDAKALGKKTLPLKYTTDFTIDCNGAKATTRIRVANSSER